MHTNLSINLPQNVKLWPAKQKPHASQEDNNLPTLTTYLPSEEYRTGQTVLICPGGGYNMTSTPKEGHRPAQFLAAHGIAAAVLEYRHAPSRHPIPLLDAQRAIRHLRAFASKHNLADDQIGIMGFSAGGHLAGTVATQPCHSDGLIGDALDSFNCQPNFAILIYPVVSFVESFSHFGSRDALLGNKPDAQVVDGLSIERVITANTPPMFIAHGQADTSVPPENALALYAALTKAKVSATLHIYENDGHGFGLGANHKWGQDLLHWLKIRQG